jgi:molybdopterin-guanine dinucleotide biosynthesis protein A
MLGALILAGGENRRIGKNKAFIEFEGRPLLVHIVEKAMTVADEIKVVVGRSNDINEYIALLPPSVDVLKDIVDGTGPLGGILTGMQSMRCSHAVVLPCDSPFVKKEILEYMFGRIKGADASIPRWPNGNIEPLHAVYHVSSTLRATREALQSEELRVADMIKRLRNVIYVSTEELKQYDSGMVSFLNINGEEDLMTAQVLGSQRQQIHPPQKLQL